MKWPFRRLSLPEPLRAATARDPVASHNDGRASSPTDWPPPDAAHAADAMIAAEEHGGTGRLILASIPYSEAIAAEVLDIDETSTVG